jgi:SAM-dependent methyltransferase
MSAAALGSSEVVAWHDVECGGYAADLALWEELAIERGSPVLELGCGTGRVALHLARRGHEVWAVEADATLAEACAERAGAEGLPVRVLVSDVRELGLADRFPLVLAPMQVLQQLGGRRGRRMALREVAARLGAGGLLAAAIVEGRPGSGAVPAVLPDMREVDGWVLSSHPVEVRATRSRLEVHRHRRAVSPSGVMHEASAADVLDLLDASTLERDAARCGLVPAGRRAVAADAWHTSSTVVLLEGA